LIDEISVEECPVFIKWINSVGGLCREHTKGLDLRMTNVPGLRSLTDALFRPTPTIHFAKEAMVLSGRLPRTVMEYAELLSMHFS
jgi:hypothetical protein